MQVKSNECNNLNKHILRNNITRTNNTSITNTNIDTNTTLNNQANKQIKFVQINLHHAKGASAVLHKTFTHSKLDIALIQEPWTYNSRVLGIPVSSSKLIYDENQTAPRTAILVNSRINFLPVTEFIKRDIVAILMEVPTSRGVAEMYVASAYFPGDAEDIPPQDVSNFVSFASVKTSPS